MKLEVLCHPNWQQLLQAWGISEKLFFFSSHHKWEETYPDFLSPCSEDSIPSKRLIRKGLRINNKHIYICMYICTYISCPKEQLDLKIRYSDRTTKRWRTAYKNMRFLSEKQLQFQGTRE